MLTNYRARKWVEACGRNDLLTKSTADLQKNYRVCGIHFEKKMFLNDLQNRLQPHAIPTIFPTLEDSSDKIIDRSTSVSEDMKVLVLEIAETHPPQNVQPVQINNIRMLEIAHERKNTSVDTVQHIITEPSASGGCKPNETTISRKRCDSVCYSDKQLCAPKDSPQKCFCKRGYKRLAHDFAAPCVVPKDCIKCGKNQEYKMCGSACPEYCGKPAGTECKLPCVRGCFCKDGYILKAERSNECILKKDCPPKY
ncbi:riddle [Holotrichia oblita]|uniref:Riddle n=1 Tax=Holotrichia oblita TaxID=644536 RepID=A0ACB9T9R3_HOLOL|nr:riddle [Holotrichia oblita]